MPRGPFWRRANIPCLSRYRRLLSPYLDGELDRSLSGEVERHLAACPRCRDEYERLRFSSRATLYLLVPEGRMPAWRGESAGPTGAEPSRAVVRALSSRPATGALWRRMLSARITIPAPVALAVLALAAAGVLAWRALPAHAPQVGIPAVQSVVVEVPVEREVVRERQVVHTVYVRPARSFPPRGQRAQPQPSVERSAPSLLAGDDAAEKPERVSAASLLDFRPVANANLRVIKEQQ